MAEMNALVADICAGIKTDVAINLWCSQTYDATPTVRENCDTRTDPGESDCPLVVVYPDIKKTGLDNSVKVHGVVISCMVWDETTQETSDGVLRYMAGPRAEELRILAMAAARLSLPSDIHIQEIETVYLPLDDFPLVTVIMGLTLTQEKLIGQNPYE